MSATKIRSASMIAAELEQKRVRQVELDTRARDVAAELEQLHAHDARALADGTPLTAASKVRDLAEEGDRLARALRVLAGDIATLSVEGDAAAETEAEQAEARLITEAAARVADVESRVRRFAQEELQPLHAAMEAAIRAARVAEQHTERARRTAGGDSHSPVSPDRTGRVLHRRGELMSLLTALKHYATHETR